MAASHHTIHAQIVKQGGQTITGAYGYKTILFLRFGDSGGFLCCGGIQRAVEQAVAEGGRDIPLQVKVISVDGRIVEGR